MRPNPDYALDDVEAVRALVRENPWATIVSHVPGAGLVASHYPVLLDCSVTSAAPTSACIGSASTRRW